MTGEETGMSDIRVPAELWEGDSEAVITSWLVDDGVNVEEGQLVAEIMVEKTEHELVAPAAGVIHIREGVDAVVGKGDVVATIE